MIGLVIVSLVACLMLAARMLYTRSLIYDFLVWNLILAWAPLLFARWREKVTRVWGRRVLWLSWLAFYPNAPYIVTDLKHVRWALNAAWWYDMALVFLFAALGMHLGLLSLERVQSEVERGRGRAAGWAFSGLVFVLAGVGIYIGRFLRWNSWDVLRDPVGLVRDFGGRLLDMGELPRIIGVSLVYGLLQALLYLAHRHRLPPPPPPAESEAGSRA
jgi:uncharacterized membrane protein